ncbi:hypothetical protein [Streptomyces sp. 058-1L]|uniref:hypothetical protein n=1 Tax=Streptomyces sp. 058-1L TaxID=2789266 RepID=UPI00397F2742
MSETFWTAVGAIGGTLAFGGVIWQAYLTRGALTVSQLMAADAIRSRLDSQAPDVDLKLDLRAGTRTPGTTPGCPATRGPPATPGTSPQIRKGKTVLFSSRY